MSPVVHEARFHFMREARIWYSRDPAQQSLPGDCQNLIVLTEEFHQEVTDDPIPRIWRLPRPVFLARGSGPVYVAELPTLCGARRGTHLAVRRIRTGQS